VVAPIRNVIHHRELLGSFVRRELAARYRGSALGFLWTFLNPLLMLVVYWLVFTIISRGVDAGKSYAVFLFTGFLPWTFVSSALIQSAGAIRNSGNLVKKVYFPNEILPLATVTSMFVSFLLTLLILIPILIVFGYPWLNPYLLALPFLFALLFLFLTALGLLLATASVFFRDVEHIITVLVSAWFFVTPILYPESLLENLATQHPKLVLLLNLNPLAGWFITYRTILLDGRLPTNGYAGPNLAYLAVLTVGLLVVAALVFERLKLRFEEEL